MNEQLSIFDIANISLEYGSRGCASCSWYNRSSKGGPRECYWNDPYWRHIKNQPLSYPTCGDFLPDEIKIARMCATCKWSNDFEYDIKEKYAESVRKHNGYTRESADDPLETPNIYCTHPEGSLNRRTAYKDVEQAGFGVGHWHRQHAWDTCDRYEEDQGGWWK